MLRQAIEAAVCAVAVFGLVAVGLVLGWSARAAGDAAAVRTLVMEVDRLSRESAAARVELDAARRAETIPPPAAPFPTE